jgi:hypothetical protein
MQQTMRPAAPPTHKEPNAQDKPLALLTNNAVQTSEPFVTPDRMDEVNKEQTKALRQASKNAKKRYAAVAANPADNGVSAFSTEMQNEKATTTQNQEEPAVNIAPKATKRQRKFKASEQRVTTTASVPTGPRKKRCQGCVHGDLLTMHLLEPRNVKHYLKKKGFLELATCAGDCKQQIKAVHAATPKASVHYCDMTNKGFYAPEDDPNKVEMECGLILCTPCYAICLAKYTMENESANGRTSRRKRGLN